MTFGDTEIGKCKFHCSKYPVYIKDVDIGKILTCKKVSIDKKIVNTLLVTKRMKKLIHHV